jgi:hypothetical protein
MWWNVSQLIVGAELDSKQRRDEPFAAARAKPVGSLV